MPLLSTLSWVVMYPAEAYTHFLLIPRAPHPSPTPHAAAMTRPWLLHKWRLHWSTPCWPRSRRWGLDSLNGSNGSPEGLKP